MKLADGSSWDMLRCVWIIPLLVYVLGAVSKVAEEGAGSLAELELESKTVVSVRGAG